MRHATLTSEDKFDRGDALLDLRKCLVQLVVVCDVPEAVEDVPHHLFEPLGRIVIAREPRAEVFRQRHRLFRVHVATEHDARDELEVLPALDRHVDLLRQAVVHVHVARLQLADPF